MTPRRWIGSGLVVIALLVVFLVHRSAATFTVVIETNQIKGTPWSTFRLDARVQPTRNLDGWQWRWTVDGVAFGVDSPAQPWRSPTIGSHHVSVVVTAADGTTRTATLELEVRRVAVTQDIALPIAPPVDPSVHDVPFGFEDVEVENDQVCIGEPSLIRVKAKAKNGRPGDLVTIIAGLEGSSGTFIRLDGEPGARQVTMQLRDPAIPSKYAEENVFVELKDCFAPATLLVVNTPDKTTADNYEFRAKLIKIERAKLTPLDAAASYRWDFDDGGTPQTSAGPILRHTFPSELIRPDEHVHTYTVKVEALDTSGMRLAKGYSTVFLHNLRRESRDRAGLIQLISHFQDLATLDRDGNRSMQVTLDNIDNTETVTLTDVSVRSLDCDGKTESTASVAVSSIFTNPTLAPRSSIAGTLIYPRGAGRSVCRLYVTVHGTSLPGKLDATGSFAMSVGVGFRQPITDAAKLAMIKKITILLGKASFTDEDVHRLEDEGKIPRGALSDSPPP